MITLPSELTEGFFILFLGGRKSPIFFYVIKISIFALDVVF